MNGGFKCSFLVQKWQLLPCWDVLEMLPQMATPPKRIWSLVPLEVWWGLTGFHDGSGHQCWNVLLCISLAETGAKTSHCTALHGEGSGDPGGIRGHCTTCLWHEGDGAKYCLIWHQHFLPWSLCIINFSVINTGGIWVNLSGFFFLFFCQMFKSLASVSLVPLVCNKASPY